MFSGGAFTIGNDGVHDVTCTAKDDADQTSAPAATTVKIDSSPPVIAYSGNAAVKVGMAGHLASLLSEVPGM